MRAGSALRAPNAVLLDRDGTLIADVPYNGDPSKVVALPGARRAIERLRVRGIKLAIVSNQSGVGRRLITMEQVDAVNRRVEELLGPIGPVFVCPHAPGDGCRCRKPESELIERAAAALGVVPAQCSLIGDTGADVAAALAAGARPILVPNEYTRPEETASAPEVARSLEEAVSILLRTSA